MKSVSLRNVQEYCKILTEQDFQLYKDEEDCYRQMWLDQSIEFWVKLVVSLRKYIINNSSKYDDKCEKEFISFLKSLTFKNFIEINTYIKNAFKNINEQEKITQELKSKFVLPLTSEMEEKFSQLRVINLKLRCAGTFINILSEWKSEREGSDFGFVVPESWYLPATTAEPLEAFIRAKWGGYKNIEDILGCKRDDIGWWKSLARKGNQPKEANEMEITKCMQDKLQYWCPPEGYHLYGMENPPESVQQSPTRTLYCWLPTQRSHWQIFDDSNDIKSKQIDFVWKMNPLFKIWPLMEHSFPPLLHQKYHTINASALMKGDPSKRYLGVATWFIQWTASFGNRYMNFIQQSRDNLAKRSAVPDMNLRKTVLEAWKQIRDDDKTALETIRNKSGAPNVLLDSIEHAADFLLEPCVLIQLPWQPVLFRQWLAAALIEILSFELEVLEFKHWPLSKELEPIARELVSLVGDVKERVLLGWTVLSFEATTYPEADIKHPDFILDNVVIPSINALRFLCSGEANHILQSLKKLSFTKPNQSLNDKINLPRSAFCINEVLCGFSVLFFGHYTFWKQFNAIRDPFPTVQLTQELGLESQLQQIQRNKQPVCPPENKPFHLHKLSIDEERIFTIMQNAASKLPEGYDMKSNLDRTVDVLKEVVIKCGHFTKEKCDTLLAMFKTDEAKSAAANIFQDIEDSRSPIQQIILSSIIYHDVNKYIATIFGQTSIMSWIIRRGAQVTEREQLIRIIGACAILLDENPKVCGTAEGKCPAECNLDAKPTLEKATMMQLISDVREKEKSANRNEFWSNFPEEWKKDVNKTKVSIPTIEDGIPAIVTALEARVGCIVWNAAQSNFTLHKDGCGTFDHAQIVQYLLPCYLSILLDAANYPESNGNTAKKQNLIKFVSELVEYYEKSYHTWIQKREPKIPDQGPIPVVPIKEMKTSRSVTTYLIEATSYALHGFAGLGRLGKDTDAMPDFNIIAKNILEYSMIDAFEPSSKIEVFNCLSWLKFMYPHAIVLYEIAYKSMPVPAPVATLSSPELQELYLASTIMHMLEAICSVQECFNLNLIGPGTADYEKMIAISEKLRIWRYVLYCIVFEVEGNFNYPPNMLTTFIKGEGKYLLLQMQNLLQTVRDKVKTRLHEIKFNTYHFPLLKKYIDLFYSGRLNTLQLFTHVVKHTIENTDPEPRPKPAKCNNCDKVEAGGELFDCCKVCQEQKFPGMNYFCSKSCQESQWKSVHLNQHVEFQLGLCDLAG